MKQFFLFILIASALIASQTLHAQFYSHCTIFNEDQKKFTVYLNGEQKNEEPKANVRLVNLTQPYYKLKIIFEDAAIPPLEKKLFQLTNADGHPVDATPVISMDKKGEYHIRWKSQTVYPGYIETNKPTVVIVNGGNSVVKETTTTTVATPQPSGVQMSFGVPGGHVNINTGSAATPAQQTTTTTTVVNGSAATAGTGCTGTVLGEDDFAGALSSVKARSTDDGKLSSAKQILSSNCMSVAQVKKVLQLFTDESKKLDLAKYAYAFTIDKGNYYKLNSEFKSESSIDELNNAIVK
jgi:hypothetical protein